LIDGFLDRTLHRRNPSPFGTTEAAEELRAIFKEPHDAEYPDFVGMFGGIGTPTRDGNEEVVGLSLDKRLHFRIDRTDKPLVTHVRVLDVDQEPWKPDDIVALAVDSDPAATLYVASRGGLQRSSDHGRTWNDVQKRLADLRIGALAVSPGSPSTLLALVGGRVFATADGGATWRMLPSTPALAFDLAVGGSVVTLHLATAKGVFGLMHSPSGPDSWA